MVTMLLPMVIVWAFQMILCGVLVVPDLGPFYLPEIDKCSGDGSNVGMTLEDIENHDFMGVSQLLIFF